MKDILLKTLKDFLSSRLRPDEPLLVGLSGGEDSSALFSLLLECRSFSPLNLHVAHFDHAWREESLAETALLQRFVESHSVPFHSERAAAAPKENSNLEEKAREERFQFFEKVYRRIGAQALILAHQREDQAETILKRMFEGAGLLALGGMRPSSLYEGMSIWRPLLNVPREDLEKWNQEKSWIPFKDRTNLDLKFLRPRMREQMFPFLEQCFGKQVRGSLCRVGEELALFKSFLEQRLELQLARSESGSLGSSLSFKELGVTDPFEIQEIIRLFLGKHGVDVSSDVLKKTVFLLGEDRSDKRLDASKGELLVERGSLVWLKKLPEPFEGSSILEDIPFTIQKEKSHWEVSLSPKSIRQKGQSLLSCFLKGEMSYRIEGDLSYCLTSYDLLVEKDKKTISSYLAKNKVPAKMKRMFPFVTNNNRLVDCDFCFNFDLKCEEYLLFSNIILKNVSN